VSLTDLGFIVVWTAIFILYIGAQLIRRPWKADRFRGSFERNNRPNTSALDTEATMRNGWQR
jgi:hypothetical protein